jgi:zinc transporter ZupT
MIRAAALAAFSGLLGGAIALLARKHPAVLERTRTFAFAAAAGVVAFHLLPEVLPAQGLVALLWMGLGFALPWGLEAGARAFGPGLLESRGFSGLRVAAEVGFAALIFHSVAEGLALVAALSQPQGQFDLEVALVAHHAPLTAAVVLPFLDLKGARSAGVRAALIGAAGVSGVLLSGLVPGFHDGTFLQTATAVTAGALLHVVSDEIRTQKFASGWERAADVGACVAGLLLAGLSAVLHLKRDGSGPLIEFLRVFGGISLASAPALFFGTLAGALLAHRPRFFRWDALLLALVLLGPACAMALAGFWALHALLAARVFPPAPASRGMPADLLDAVRARAPSLLTLLIVAAGLEVSGPPLLDHPLTKALLLVALGLCARLDEAGAVLVAAVLVGKGMDGILAVTVLGIGPSLRSAIFHARPIPWGWRALVWRVAAMLLVLVGATRLLEEENATTAARAALSIVRAPIAAQAAASPLGAAAAGVLIAIALATLWTAGVRGWFSPLRHGPRAA